MDVLLKRWNIKKQSKFPVLLQNFFLGDDRSETETGENPRDCRVPLIRLQMRGNNGIVQKKSYVEYSVCNGSKWTMQ